MSGIKGAVEQLETQMAALPASLEKKLAAIRSTSWDPRNGRYRGVFASEDDARCFGLFILAKAGGNDRAADALKGEMKSVFERALGGTTATGDGLVPIEYSARIERLVEAFGVWAARAFPMTMTSDQLTFQKRVSGLKVFKTGYNVEATASDINFATISLNADELNTLVLLPKALSEDAAPDVGELVALEIALAFAEATDSAGFIGDGTPTYLDIQGITTRLVTINGVDDGGGLVLGTGAGGAGWTGLTEVDFLKCVGQLPLYRGIQPAWYASNPFIWTVMNKIALDKGGVTRMEIAGEQKLQFLGYEVVPTQVMPKTAGNSQVACLFGDLRLSSTHGRRRELFIEESRDAKFTARQLAILGTKRAAITNHSLGDATNAGPMIGLITPSA